MTKVLAFWRASQSGQFFWKTVFCVLVTHITRTNRLTLVNTRCGNSQKAKSMETAKNNNNNEHKCSFVGHYLRIDPISSVAGTQQQLNGRF